MEFKGGAICRLCLSKNECFFNIFVSNRIYGYVPAVVISDLLNVQVSETDGYPHVICIPCLTKLTNYKTFREQCHSAKVTFDKTFSRNVNLFLPEAESRSTPNFHLDDQVGSGSEEMVAADVKEKSVTADSSQDLLPEIKQESVDIGDDVVNNVQEMLPEIKQESVEIEEDEESFNQTLDPMQDMTPESSNIAETVGSHFQRQTIDSSEESHIVEIDPIDQQSLPFGMPHVIKSIRGKEKLVDANKYIYMEQKKNIRGTKTYWKCEVRECRARVHTWSNSGECYTIIKRIGEHHHAPSPVKPKIRKILDEMKVLAITTDLSVQALISTAMQNLDEDEVLQLPSISCLSRNIRNWRQAATSEWPQHEWIGNT